MSLSFDTFDPRDDVVGVLDLVNVNTADGDVGFLLGTDGIFTDVTGKRWYGSTLLSASRLQSAINGKAPSGTIGLSYIQDPDQPDLIDQIKAQGGAYLIGRPVTFYWQPLHDMAEFYAPTIAPQMFLSRIMRTVTMTAEGAQTRQISVGFEAWTEDRRAARRIPLNTEGHARILGAPNPSLEFMPTDAFEEEKLFG